MIDIQEEPWVEVAIQLKRAGVSWNKISDELYRVIGERLPKEKIRSRLRRRMTEIHQSKQSVTPLSRLLTLLKAGPKDLTTLSSILNQSPGIVLKLIERLNSQQYDIQETDGQYRLLREVMEGEQVFRENIQGRRFKFGVCGDTHLCSKYQQLSYLNQFYERCKRDQISVIYHTGDILDGEGLYRGHRYELHTLGVDSQVSYTVQNYPREEGIETKFITGNHDLCYYKSMGLDVGRLISREREDLIYLGQLAAWVEIAPGIQLYLLHPDGGVAYAISYRPQKIAAGFVSGEKPNVMLLGHWHQHETLFERNIHIVQTGCFQSQTGQKNSLDASQASLIIS